MNYDYAIQVLMRALEDQDEELGYANANIAMLDKIVGEGLSDYPAVRTEEQERLNRAIPRRANLALAIETLLNVQAGIPITSIRDHNESS